MNECHTYNCKDGAAFNVTIGKSSPHGKCLAHTLQELNIWVHGYTTERYIPEITVGPLHTSSVDEFKDDVEDIPDPKVTYAKEQETEYVQAFHALSEDMENDPTYYVFESSLFAVLDIIHKRLQNLEGGDEE